jgi:tripartite-type tricarboxylate transporter receptor subunit TctC
MPVNPKPGGRTTRRHLVALLAAAGAVGAALPGPARAQAYPTKPVRLIVPFAAGGTTDIVSRAIADALGRELGQPVIVDNKGGGGGSLGADMVAKAAPDGYTIGMATVSTLATNPATNPKTPYDPIRDFVPIVNVANVPNVLTVNPAVPAQDVKSFIALLKASPGKYSYASPGVGSISHLDGELFKALTGTFMTHIPYRGSGPALNDVLSGVVQVQFDNLPSSMPHIKGGKLRALAVAAPQRVEALPNVPTFAEVGLRDVNNMAWYGLVAPPNTPDDIVRKLHDATAKVIAEPAVKRRFAEVGAYPDGGSSQQYATMIRNELALRKRIATERKISLQE